MGAIIFNSFLFFILIFLLIILSMVWPPDSPWSPWWRTSKNKARAMCKLAKISKKDIVYDLGCGEATALIVATKEFGANGVGIEIDPLRFFISKINVLVNRVSTRVKIIKDNFFNQDISKATIIFVYLVPKALKRLKPKFLKELKPGTKIVSYKYEVDLPLALYDKVHEIRVYKIPNNT
ncbi:MAG: class I SAM-dependent methyltransferase [Patescibacteria group bacterium]|nr:class I SAM-dependent methyltransferase [Patescibacteria group bacterium]